LITGTNIDKDELIKASKTAIRFNQGKPDWTQVDFKAFEPMIRVLEFGAQKYAKGNWRKGLSKDNILASLQRHVGELIDAVNTGEEEIDHESGLHLIGHILCNCMFYSRLHVIDKEKTA
jgi:NTP pyrophosphatase (non-canonical NTP hydrolase)